MRRHPRRSTGVAVLRRAARAQGESRKGAGHRMKLCRSEDPLLAAAPGTWTNQRRPAGEAARVNVACKLSCRARLGGAPPRLSVYGLSLSSAATTGWT